MLAGLRPITQNLHHQPLCVQLMRYFHSNTNSKTHVTVTASSTSAKLPQYAVAVKTSKPLLTRPVQPVMSVCANLQDILALGAIFATTDSVAVLQVLNKDRSPILFSLVFGEGVINDAAGVALLRAIQV